MSGTIILANLMKIERAIFVAGNISFSIRNIASVSILRNPDKRSDYFTCLKVFGLAPAIIAVSALISPIITAMGSDGGTIPGRKVMDTAGALIVMGIMANVALFLYCLVKERMRIANEPTHFLKLQTNANSSSELYASSVQFLQKIKAAIEEAIQRPDGAVSYTFNRTTQKIDRQENVSNMIQHSTVGNFVGGSASNVNQTANITVQGLQDIAALMQLVHASNNQYRDFFLSHLSVLQNHLSGGGATKATAQASWQEIVKHIGLVAGAGSNVWELVARIARLFS